MSVVAEEVRRTQPMQERLLRVEHGNALVMAESGYWYSLNQLQGWLSDYRDEHKLDEQVR